ncbi:MAG: hypothetical protein MI867_11355 [Pseudomonadales bacterium]|nr:hypothetical protein [Pseudomonadales bacterium]
MNLDLLTLRNFRLVLACLCLAILTACGSGSSGDGDDDDDDDDDNPFLALGALPLEVQHPENNLPNADKTELGKMLYWDPILSGDKDVACVTCHHPSMGFSESLQLSKGVGAVGLGEDRTGGALVKRNAPTVINTAFNGIDETLQYSPEDAPMFWDNRATSLESQAVLPILSKEEMRGESIEEDDDVFPTLIARLEEIPEYVEMFNAAFGDAAITEERIAFAIASFERSIIANNSRFDQYMRGDETALNQEELEGLDLFMEAGCADCHNGPMLSNYELHVVGVPESDQSVLLPEVDKGAGSYEFRTPTLRNLSLTAPYMHNGAFETLEEVMLFYFDATEGESIHPDLQLADLDPDIREMDLEDADADDLKAIISFMRTLDDNNFDNSVPTSVPSGLNPGGFITNP